MQVPHATKFDMISTVIPVFNNESTLAACLSALIPAAVEGLVREVIVADGGSTDQTMKIADFSGAETVIGGATRASRLIAGAAKARFPWLLFLPPDAVLGYDWTREVEAFITSSSESKNASAAAVFRFGIDDRGFAPRAIELATRAGHAVCGIATSEQGLLISRSCYTALGGFRQMPLLEDLDLVRRIGRSKFTRLRTPLVSSAQRYRSEGYAARLRHHGLNLLLYGINVPVERIASLRNSPKTGPIGT